MFSAALIIIFLIAPTDGADKPRGVSITKVSFYQPGKEFKCLTSGEVVPFEFINDDYCDCKDGTDEPGTSACSNGFFFCENRGYRGTYITSSKVNDGICDCCDGSDEYEERIKCNNICDELGQKEREEREVFRQLQEQGYRIKQEYMQQAKRTKDEKRARLSEIEKDQSIVKAVRDELQAKKEAAEAPEKAAKEQHEKVWEEIKAKQLAEKEKGNAVLAFAELDINNDKQVDYVEIQRRSEFDIDSDGTVSEEEAKEYLDDHEKVDLAYFQDKVWANVKDIYKPSQPETSEEEKPRGETEAAPDESGTTQPPPASEKVEESKPVTEEEKMPPYDEDTQKLIEVAEAARKEFEEADRKLKDVESEISSIKQYLEVDYGPDEEYGALRGQCFEYTDREYTYKLCPFDKTSQRPKSGGTETSLGKWGHWYGPEEDKYDAMKYENGQNCWNGPNRSCHVNLHCGTENKLTGASEPSRCEYQFEFTTPARCRQPEVPPASHEHVEL